MSQKLTLSSDEVEKVRSELSEWEDQYGKLQAELETCKGLLAKTTEDLDDTKKQLEQLQDTEQQLHDTTQKLNATTQELNATTQELNATLRKLNDTDIEFDTRVDAALAEAKTSEDKLKKELQWVKDCHDEARTEVEQLSEHADETREKLEVLRRDNALLVRDIVDQKNNIAHLKEINDDLLTEISTKDARRSALTRERDDFKVRLAEALLALKEREESEIEARNELARIEAETEDAARGLSEQNDALLVEINTLSKHVDEHKQVVDVKDERIAFLKSQNEMLENKLQEEQAHSSVNTNAVRPPTYRSVSGRSMLDELDELSDAEFDDDISIETRSNVEEPATVLISLELSDVREVIRIVPQVVSTPALTISVSDAVCTVPWRQDSLMEHCPVNNIPSIEPAQPAAPRMTYYNRTLVDYPPSEPAAPTLSLFHNTVGYLSPFEPRPAPLALSEINQASDYAPIEPATFTPELSAPTLSLSERTVECTSPSKPKIVPLRLSKVYDAFDYAPVEPTIPLSEPEAPILSPYEHTVEAVALSEPRIAPLMLSSIKQALDYAPIEPTVSNPEPAAHCLSLSHHTVESIFPVEPRIASPQLSGVNAAVHYEPLEPVISASVTTAGLQELSLHVDEALEYPPIEPTHLKLHAISEAPRLIAGVAEKAGFSLEPDSGAVVNNHITNITNTTNLTTHIDARQFKITTSRKDLPTKSSPRNIPTSYASSASVPHDDSGVFGGLSMKPRHRRTPVDPSDKLGKPGNTDTNTLDKITKTWPVEEPTQNKLSTPSCTTPTTSKAIQVTTSGKNLSLSSLAHNILHGLMVVLAIHWWLIWNKLYDWEHANGVGFDKGVGNVHDRYGQYGNGHVLLGMLPHNLLSADSPLPATAINIITSTISALEGWIGYEPTPLF